MNYKAELLRDYSYKNCKKIADHAAKNPECIGDLIQLMFDKNPRLAQKAAWPVCMLGKKQPNLMEPHIEQLIKGIYSTTHNAIPRNCLRVLAEMALTEPHESVVVNHCFDLIQNYDKAIAIRAFSMQIIMNAGKKHRELLRELYTLMEDRIPLEPPGIKSKFRHLRKDLKKV